MMRSCVLVVLVAAVVAAVDVPVRPCSPEATQCTVTSLRIDPCKEYPRPCKLKKKTNATIEFDFTPDFSTSNLKTAAFLDNSAANAKFAQLLEDACQYTPCPSAAGRSQAYAFQLYVGKTLPPGTYPVKWTLWNGDNDEQKCCFKVNIKIAK